MDSAIGKLYTIKSVEGDAGVFFEGRECTWPLECLELEALGDIRSGDLVVITDHDGIYTSYQEMANLMGLTRRREFTYASTKTRSGF